MQWHYTALPCLIFLFGCLNFGAEYGCAKGQETDLWGLWGEWTQENEDTSIRSRTCKVAGKCTGNSIQRRKKSVKETSTIENVNQPPTGDLWGPWSEWAQESSDTWARNRVCKEAGKCTGNAIQKRKKSGPAVTEPSDETLFGVDQYVDDWFAWSAWAIDPDGWWIRNRTCKSPLYSGKCRGVSTQKKKTSIKPGGEDEVEFLEDWEAWSKWTEETEGFWTRSRNCRNRKTTGQCRGSPFQRKTKKVTYYYQMEVDRGEVLEDWQPWGEWVAESDEVSTRKRVCKNKGPGANCRGKETQKRKKVQKVSEEESDKDAKITNEYPEDWENWGAWTLGDDGWWERKRECKNLLTSRQCRGISSQMRKISGGAEPGDVPGDWDPWTEWAQESEGVFTRKRNCKNSWSSGKCRGSSLQRKRIKIIYEYVIESDGEEVAEDWDIWGEWVEESEGVWTRKRVCKNKGPKGNCRGKAVQKKKRVRKEDEAVVEEEVTEDWGQWTEWTEESDGVWTRSRKCLKGSQEKCKGISMQKRKRKETEEFETEVDTGEKPEDWDVWGEWVEESEGVWIRKRSCKNKGPGAKCRGKTIQKRKRIEIEPDEEPEPEPEFLFEVEVPEDWDQWTEWTEESEGVWVRKRSCKNPITSRKCRGSSLQRKVVKIIFEYVVEVDIEEVLEDWETWGEWVQEPDGVWIRKRVCKNKGPGGKCRGKTIQKRKRVTKETKVDVEEEVTEDWETWSEWTVESDGVWIRRRTCANKGTSRKCRGRSVQRKTKKVTESYEIEVDEEEKPEDWEIWGEWIEESDGVWSRKRVCKNKGPKGKCRGRVIQRRRRLKKDPEPVVDPKNIIEKEVPEDWDQWTEWIVESEGVWVRKRTCKNPVTSGKCRGSNLQRRIKKIISEYEVEVDDEEVIEDWETWGDWIEDSDGVWSRRRVCKNKGKNAKCRGKTIQKRRRIRKDDESVIEEEVTDDWDTWSDWIEEPEGIWIRRRTCKNAGPSGKCRGISVQKRRKTAIEEFEVEVDKDEKPEDWDTWGEWVEESYGVWVRKRVCKNKGPGGKCRGRKIQTRKRIKVEPEPDFAFEKEVPEDWNPWMEWTDESEGVWTRKRTCKNPRKSGKCRGSNLQRKRTRIIYDYEIEVDSDEVLEDWETWGEWVEESDGVWIKKRVCKNKGPGGKCRGKTVHRRRRISKETDTVVEEEVTEDWDTWSEWTKETEGVWTRRRNCRTKSPSGKCRGPSLQRRTKKVTVSYDIEVDKDDKPEDWNIWGEWVEESEGVWIRKRVCKNKGPGGKCRGKVTQRRRRIEKDPEPESVIEKEVPEDWDQWTEWTPESEGVWVRKRICKNPMTSGKCRGINLQRKVKKIIYEFEVEVDKDEVIEDWETWGEWIEDTDGIWVRRRVCKNKGPGGKCRGKIVQKRKLIKKDDKSVIEEETTEDWDVWSEWVVETEGVWVRRRKCKNLGPSGKCRGVNLQRRRKKVTEEFEVETDTEEVPEDWDVWGEWVQESDGIWIRKRVCKNKGPGGKCRGKTIQKRKRVVEEPIVDGVWGQWSPWSSLTGLNNPETITRTRKCDSPEPSNGGKPCDGPQTDSQLIYKPIDGNWGQWSPWSEILPDSTVIVRTRNCNSPAPLYNGKKCFGPEEEVKDVVRPTNGNWGPWTPWSTKTGLTNPETVKRSRSCDSPSPSNGGLACEGKPEETNIVYNPIDGKWTEWGPWSTPEPGSTKIKRKRTCTNPKPQYGGKACVGPSEETSDIVLPTNGNWGPWASWSDLTGKTNPETKTRKRSCDNPSPANGGKNCIGPATEEEVVYRPIDGGWGEWSPWSDPTIELNTVTRTRVCNRPKPAYGGKECVGPATELKDVILPVDGNWGVWEPWSTPTGDSNPEVVTRKRFCDNPSPANGGKACPGKPKEEKEVYSPINGGFSEWSEWEVLTVGKKIRRRVCNNPSPKFGGANCIGSDEETVDVAIPVNGVWGPWSAWSTPTGLTNPETITRTRSCDNPSPANGGSDCDGSPTDSLEIKKPIDGNWTPWSEWMLTDDKTNYKRQRTCTNPQPIFGGEQCKGPDFELKPYVKPIDGKWGEWQPWSPIVGATNPETIKRRRVCNNPAPSGGGADCPGPSVEEQLVYKPIDGNWGLWAPWTEDLTVGVKVRRRMCDNPPTQYNGKNCVGEDKETVDIVKPTDGKWSDWSPWSEPTKTSNPEIVYRKRYCNNPSPANGGKVCEGDFEESKEIFFPIDGQWGEWTPWSEVKKGTTSVTRTRSCNSPAPKYQGLQCIGFDSESKDVVIPTDGNWGPWGPFTEPTGKTNPETITRVRFCDNPSPANNGADCVGPNEEKQLVYRPIDGSWSEWSIWSEPTKDSKTVSRSRKCDNPTPMYNGKPCSGPATEVKDVIKPTDGKWGEWSEWTEPKHDTNPEKVIRKRFCNNPSPANGGKECEGDDRETKEVYTPVNGNWGEWTTWAAIEGDNTKVKRTRKCDSPAPQYNGTKCIGSEAETKPIEKPVDGKWGEWSPWSQPTGISNPEVLKRTRGCDNPSPANGGLTCSGSPIESKVYTKPIDGGWSEWTEWSTLLGLTNPENVTRSRICSMPSPAYDGKPCAGVDVEVMEITRPIDGSWGPWSEWEPSTDTTKEDIFVRTRKCDNPTPKFNGKDCPGNITESKYIPTPVNGQWGPWTEWSKPTWKTNPDTVTRTRNCDKPAPKNGGNYCDGPKDDNKEVTQPIDGSWGPWTAWSAPDEKISPVNVTRTRECNSPEAKYGGKECVGPVIETKLITKPTPVNGGWSDWSPWAEPLGIKGLEVVNRTRTCSNPIPLFNGKTCEGPTTDLKNITTPLDGEWGVWGPWSTPTLKTNPETLTRTRKCDSPAPLYGGVPCVGIESETVLYSTPINGNWTNWSEWSKPTGLSNPETLTRVRSCTNPAPALGGEGCVGEPIDGKEYSTPVDGNWSPWSEWSSPLGVTQPETLSRTRTCDSPAPANGGKDCEGNLVESKEYYTPTYGNWGPWSEWSIPTGKAEIEVITRTRKCDSPPPQYAPPCEGPVSENTTVIKKAPKPVDGGWGDWNEWSKPTGLNNPEPLSRFRVCDKPTPAFGGVPCTGPLTESKEYFNPVDGRWGEWTPWSKPIVDGDTQITSRFRECDSPAPAYDGKDCEGDADEVLEIIKKQPEPIDGNWGPWSDWQIVSISENPTNRTRRRNCDNPSPSFGGKKCEGTPIEVELYNQPIDGSWGEWSPWTETVNKAKVEVMLRKRECNKPAPKYEGKPCVGPAEEETEIVREFQTPVDGQWGPWNSWSTPLKLTNPETLSRSRVCDRPTPAFGGKFCEGPGTEIKEVFIPIDGNWGEWSVWTEPTGLVNPELIKRTRKCDSPAAEYSGLPCVGPDTETKEVFTPVNGGWSPWSEWVTVPEGGLARSRVCDNPFPAYGGKDCVDLPQEKAEVVEGKPQSVDGNWGGWGEWTVLSKTDQTETFTRTRACDNPTPNFGGKDCEGPSSESQTVNLPINGQWSPWGDWSVPVVEGNVETSKRTRKCNNPAPLNGGKDCVGLVEEIKKVKKDLPMPIDGGWTEWSGWIQDTPKVIKRVRSCTNPIAQNNGKECKGPNTETKVKLICPRNYKYIPETKKCYKLIKKKLTWEGARQTCKNLNTNSHLVTIDSQTEQSSLQKFFASINSTLMKDCSDQENKYLNIWTAGKRLASQPGSHFVWLPYNDREPRKIIYSAWKGNAPNLRPTTGEQCTYFSMPDYKWVSGPCGCAKGGKEEGLNIEDLVDYQYDYDYEYSTDVDQDSFDSTEEPEGWELWAEWTQDETGFWVRERKCKKGDGQCVGRKKQKRKRLTKEWFEYEEEYVDTTEVIDDWNVWGEWTEENGYWVRWRKCRNDPESGRCRGKPAQRKRKTDYDYAYEYEDSVTTDVPGDWNPWSEWAEDKDGFWIRKRTCKKDGGKCVGKNSQRRKLIKISEEQKEDYEFDSTEVSEEWEPWSEWTQDEDSFWVRRRKCKKADGKCRGRKVQYKKHLKWIIGEEAHVDSTELLEDWESWAEWAFDDEGYWVRRRKCKKGDKSKCKGRTVQRKKHIKTIWQKEKEGLGDVDSTEEPKDWDIWSEWTKDKEGYWIRKRTCKKEATGGKCKGRNVQRRRRIKWKIVLVRPEEVEDPKDWDIWSEWTEDEFGYWVRNRKCKKVDGKCRGKATQKRRKIVKEWGKHDGTSWSLEKVNATVPDFPEDWNLWSQWVVQPDGWWMRKRNCKNPGGKCRGGDKQRKRKRTWRIDKSYAYTIDESRDVGVDSPEDWETWGNWEPIGQNFYIRRRVCRNAKGPCRGRKTQKRKRILSISTDSSEDVWLIEKFTDKDYPEDWFQWSDWIWSSDEGWVRERRCRNDLSSGKCRGPQRQKKTLRIEWIEKIKTEQEKKFDEDWSLVSDDIDSVPEDWENWGLWVPKSEIELVRERKCRKPDGKCKGKAKQRRRKRTWLIVGSWSIDEEIPTALEVTEDWQQWTPWMQTKNGWWSRTRECKNKGPGAKCRGSRKQTKRKKGWGSLKLIGDQLKKEQDGGSWAIDVSFDEVPEFREDWEVWGEWVKETDDSWIRYRNCKLPGALGKCRGKPRQRKILKKTKEDWQVYQEEHEQPEEEEESQVDDWSVDISADYVKSVPSDWDVWSQWSIDAKGEIRRERKCIKKDGKCRGRKVQRKVKRNWKAAGDFLVDDGLQPGETQVDGDWEAWSKWKLVGLKRWVRDRKCKNPKGTCRGSRKQTRKMGRRWVKVRVTLIDPGSWSAQVAGDSKVPEVLQDWELWGKWEVIGDKLTRKRFCRNRALGGNCRGNSEEWRRRRRWQYEGGWSLDIPAKKVEEVKDDWLLWGGWTLDVDGTWIRVRKCKNKKDGPCRGDNKQRRRVRKTPTFDLEGFKKFILRDRLEKDVKSSSWDRIIAEKLEGSDGATSQLWFMKMLKWQETRGDDWQAMKLGDITDDDLVKRFKMSYEKYAEGWKQLSEDDYYEWETVLVNKTKTSTKTTTESDKWTTWTTGGGSTTVRRNKTTTTYYEEETYSFDDDMDGEDEYEWGTFKIGKDGKITNVESKGTFKGSPNVKSKRAPRLKRAVLDEYDPKCGINMCALCEMELE